MNNAQIYSNVVTSKELEQLKRDLLGVKAERDAIKFQRESELKMIARKLGVPYKAHHIIQAIGERGAYIARLKDKLDVVESERDAYKAHRDDLKAEAYQAQGFFGRLFGRAPRPWEG